MNRCIPFRFTRVSTIFVLFFAISMVLGSPTMSQAERFFQTPNTWYTKIPATTVVDPNSANYIQDILTNNAGWNLNKGEWSVPIWVAEAETPLVTVTASAKATLQGWNIVPIPSHATPAAHGVVGVYRDRHMTIISHDRRYAWDFFGAVKTSATSWKTVSMVKLDLSQDGINSPYDNTGSVRACPTSLLHGIMTYDEVVNKGHIDHALAFAYSGEMKKAHWGAFPCQSWREGVSDRPYAMNIGTRLQLDPNFDINTLTGAQKVVAKALQEYGMIFVENCGKGCNSLYAENLEYKPESWQGKLGSLWGIPVHKLRVVEQP